MKYADVGYAGAPAVVPGLPGNFGLKGYRVVPILGATATATDVIAAYAALVMRVSRASQSRAISNDVAGYNVVDDVAIPGPDWVRSPGFNALTIQNGVNGVTYRVWWAEDCFEIVDAASPPYLNGFVGPGSAVGAPNSVLIGPSGAVTQTPASAAGNKPVLATDGVAIPVGVRGAYATISAVVGQTLSAPAVGLVWWRYSFQLSRWCETEIQQTFPSGARDAAGVEQDVKAMFPGDRLYVEARSCAVSGGATIVVSLTVS